MRFFQKSRDTPALMCGIACALVGIVVLIGWYTHKISLIQVHPNFAPMQYNTALAFILAGLGLVSLTFDRSKFAVFFGSCTFALGGLTLFQYYSGMDVGIDEFFMDAYVNVKTTHPGRMAPITALCFSLSGLALILNAQGRKVQISIATSIIVLSILSIIGYLMNIKGVYGWGNLTRMAIHTASCFVILGAGFVYLARKGRQQNNTGVSRLLPLTLSSLFFILSFFSSFAIKEATQVRNVEHFDRIVSDTNQALVERFRLYELSLWGGVGLYDASKDVKRAEWRSYVNALDLKTNLPGIAGLGYIDFVQSGRLSDYIKDVRRDAAPQFTNHPETQNANKYIIKFIEPEGFNAKALGLDISFENNRRQAAERARDKAQAALTKTITLVQDGKQTPGFLMLVPVYDSASPPRTAEKRRAQLQGWVYAPFIASDFMKGLTSNNQDQVNIEVYDGQEETEGNLIYRSGFVSSDLNPYKTKTTVNLTGRDWTINWQATENFVPIANQKFPLVILFLGAVCSLLLYAALSWLLRTNEIISNEVKKQTKRLFQSEKQLQLVFDSAGEGILGLNLNGYAMFANKAAEGLLGYRPDEIVGAYLPDLITNTIGAKAAHDTEDYSFMSTLSDGERRTIANEHFFHKDGSKVPVEYTSKPIINDGNDIDGAVIVFRDITERKAADTKIKEANAELEEFAYRTSHDLRSPLVSSRALLNIAEKAIDAGDNAKAIASLTHTQKSLKKLEELVKDILVLTQTKNEDEERQSIDMQTLIDEAIAKLQYMDNFDHLDIQQDLKFSKSFTSMKNRMVLIVENLISNAVKYQDLTKENSYLKISTYQADNQFVLTFRDNGIGIPKDQQSSLFQMFKRFHPKTSFGSGLGLYMMKKSVAILGGNISFEDPGDGALFKIIIPVI